MPTPRRFMRCLLLAIFLSLPARAESVKDREGAVRGDRTAMEGRSSWLYNEVDRGFEEARRTGKPLMVVLRCVPCLACMGIDAAVLEAKDLNPLLDRFVRVRLINANDLDLARFQFDFDLSFSTLFFNGDGTLYGRFGSWQHQKNPQEADLASFRRALEAALSLHQEYPRNRESLAGKQGLSMPFKSPLEIPGLAGKYQRSLDWSGKVVQSCVHCHMIGDAIRTMHRTRDGAIPSTWIYPQPAPETVGLRLAPDQVASVVGVTPSSPAARAGVRVGDRLSAVDGQPLLSVADVSWALHRAPEEGGVPLTVEREGRSTPLMLELPKDWRYAADISRRVGTWGMRAMALGGLQLDDLNDAEREARGMPQTGMALRVRHAGEYGIHAAAKNAGFRKDDLLVEVDSFRERISESTLIGRVIREHRPGERLRVSVVRGADRLTLELPVQ